MIVTNKQWADAARATLEEKWSGDDEDFTECHLCTTTRRILLQDCAGCPVVKVFGYRCISRGGPLYDGPPDMDLIRTCLALIIAIYETDGMEV